LNGHIDGSFDFEKDKKGDSAEGKEMLLCNGSLMTTRTKLLLIMRRSRVTYDDL